MAPTVSDESQMKSGWNRMIAVSISHDNWKKYQENLTMLQTYPVVIITHSIYLQSLLSQQKTLDFLHSKKELDVLEI